MKVFKVESFFKCDFLVAVSLDDDTLTMHSTAVLLTLSGTGFLYFFKFRSSFDLKNSYVMVNSSAIGHYSFHKFKNI